MGFRTVAFPFPPSPAVRARARDLGVDLAQGSPAEGERIRHADLDAYLRYGASEGYQPPHASRARPDEPVKVIGMRRRIAENMARSEEHTSELQSLMRISYAVFCLKKKKNKKQNHNQYIVNKEKHKYNNIIL